MKDSGFLFIARDRFLDEAIISAKQIRDVMPNSNIAIVTNKEVDEAELFDKVIHKDMKSNLSNKIFHLQNTPYKKTLYIDTDIYVNEDVSEIFKLLERFDFAAAIDQHRTMDYPNYEAFPGYQGGLFAYRKNETFLEFRQDWEDRYMEDHNGEMIPDQPTFRKAILSSDLDIATLPREYNCRVMHPGQVAGKAKIFHGRLLKDIDFIGAQHKINMEKAVQKINQKQGPRTFALQRGHLSVRKNTKSIILQIRDGLKKYGARKSAVKGLDKIGTKLFR